MTMAYDFSIENTDELKRIDKIKNINDLKREYICKIELTT